MLVKRFNLRLMIYPFEEFRVPAKGAYSTTLWEPCRGVGGFHAHNGIQALLRLSYQESNSGCCDWTPGHSHKRDIGFTKFKKSDWAKRSSPGWEMVVDPPFLPFSTVLSPNATVPHQSVFYNIPKSEEQKNVSRSGPRYRQYEFIQHHRLPKPQH